MSNKQRTAEIQVESRGEIAILHVTGELDALAGPDLEDSARKALDRGARRCIIDLGGASFIDSIGVGSLIRIHRLAGERRSAIIVAGAQGMIAQLIKITQLHRIFEVAATIDDAIRSATEELAARSAAGEE